MNRDTIQFLVNQNLRAFRAAYEEGLDKEPAKWEWFKSLDTTVAVGQIWIVPTKNHRHGFTVVKIMEVDSDINLDDQGLMCRWLVQRVNEAQFKALLEAEGQIIADINRAQLKKKRADLAGDLAEYYTPPSNNLLLSPAAQTEHRPPTPPTSPYPVDTPEPKKV